MIEGALNRNRTFKEESSLAKIMLRIVSFQLALILFKPACIFKHPYNPISGTSGSQVQLGAFPEMSSWHPVTVLHSCPQIDL